MAGFTLSAYRTVSPLLPALVRMLSPLIPKLKTFDLLRQDLFLELDRKLSSRPKPDCRLWVHASSVGEFEQARPVIAELKRHHQNIDVVVSFLSDSGYEARKDFPDATAVFYLPLDTPDNAEKLVNLIRPDIVMLMRYDFWPNHLIAARKGGAKLLLSAAALPPGSPYFKPLFKSFYRDIFALFDSIFTIDEYDREAFRNTFGCRSVVQAGDPRFDQVLERQMKSDNRAARLKPLFRDRMVLVGGSTWEPDEEILVPAWLPFQEKLSLVLVPHKVERQNIDRIMERLRERHIEAVKLSSLDETFDPKTTVLVVDQTGFLAELYAIASVAYVGGAFGVNVHNTIEPAVHGIPVLFGPKHSNSPEAGALIDAEAATMVHNENELHKAIARFMDAPEHLRKTGQKASDFVHSRLGATTIISDAILQLCK
jgi:3-deoxy-D-manno-octulosonic-acid transferase